MTTSTETKSIQDQIRERLQQQGTLSSADIAAAARPQEEDTTGPVTGTVEVEVNQEEFDDPLTKAQSGTESLRLTSPGAGMALENIDNIMVEVTEEERNLFLDSVVNGGRFVLPFSVFNNRVHGTIRSRTQRETRAIIMQLQREINNKEIITDSDYIVRLRSALMAAQLATYNGSEAPELLEPLFPTTKGPKDTQPPAWLPQAADWEKLDEGVAVALYEEIRKFELKYWTMVRSAADQNFWQPVTST